MCFRYFESIYHSPVSSVTFVKHIHDLERVVSSREVTLMALERSMIRDYLEARPLNMSLSINMSSWNAVHTTPSSAEPMTPPSVEPSQRTAHLRRALTKENEEVKAFQLYYRAEGSKHDEMMVELAPEILAKRLCMSEDTIELDLAELNILKQSKFQFRRESLRRSSTFSFLRLVNSGESNDIRGDAVVNAAECKDEYKEELGAKILRSKDCVDNVNAVDAVVLENCVLGNDGCDGDDHDYESDDDVISLPQRPDGQQIPSPRTSRPRTVLGFMQGQGPPHRRAMSLDRVPEGCPDQSPLRSKVPSKRLSIDLAEIQAMIDVLDAAQVFHFLKNHSLARGTFNC